MSAAEIHGELCAAVYGQNVMSEKKSNTKVQNIQRWRVNIHHEELACWPSVESHLFFFKVLVK
jgi:hypothetical protein